MSSNGYWWFQWAAANGTPLLLFAVIALWMRRFWRRNLERAEEMLRVTRDNGELLRQATARLEEIREILKGKV